MTMLLLGSLVYYDGGLLWKHVDERWKRSFTTEAVKHCTVFICYSLISAESVTVAFGQTDRKRDVLQTEEEEFGQNKEANVQ